MEIKNNEHFMEPVQVEDYLQYLREDERSQATLEKYRRDVMGFYLSLPAGKQVDKHTVQGYKELLLQRYAVSSVNSILTALNGFFRYVGWHECRVRTVKTQRNLFCAPEKELTKKEYLRLLAAAERENNERLNLLMQTICSTGIRVSELRFVTVDAVRQGRACVSCKSKTRVIFLPKPLCRVLGAYIRKRGIKSGAIFITRSGKPMDRSNIWAAMKALCVSAGVEPGKVFPHNLRHLFARTFYSIEKDISRLADLLGHSSIETTRIYTISSGEEHRRKIELLGLVV
ncbi:Tyrosine recombinase XerD [anaerobic digester metagenome]